MTDSYPVTAADVVRIYRYLLEHAAETILSALAEATEAGTDGFRQYVGIPDAANGLPWAVKQGWSCCRPARILHTSGLVGEGNRYVVVVLTSHPASVTDGVGSRRVTAVVSALRPLLGGGTS
ncbi:hypothetical protein [Amycolatopsis minnesotensis]|uniref:hypothetical protein n=1 Tax=Amycolatopsis minnesotensis TaxID=337894 RepID=UPI0031CF8439